MADSRALSSREIKKDVRRQKINWTRLITLHDIPWFHWRYDSITAVTVRYSLKVVFLSFGNLSLATETYN